jgi:hypothetical protein
MSGAKKIYVGIRRCGNKHCAPGHCACMLGLFARKGFTCQKGDWVASYGPVKPVLFSVLRKKYRQFVRYATIIPKDMAKEYGLAKPSPDDDWFLIPDVTTKGVYVFGDKCPRRPTEHLNDAVGLDGTHLGALFNTRLPGEQAHVTWTVTPPSSTNGAQWGVDFSAVRYMKPKEDTELLSDYGPHYCLAIQDAIDKAAFKESSGARIVSGGRKEGSKIKPDYKAFPTRPAFMRYLRSKL